MIHYRLQTVIQPLAACIHSIFQSFHSFKNIPIPNENVPSKDEPVGTREGRVENKGTRLLMEQKIIDTRQLYALFIVCRVITVTNNDNFLEIIRNMP